jgi:predicted NBD/HSP70 family sugar kinase
MNEGELRTLLAERESATPESRLVRLFSERGPLSAADIARATGLARSTISMALAELRRSDLLVEIPPAESARGVGRPAATYALNPEAGTCVGLHLGRDGLRLLVADVSHHVICEKSIALERDYSPAAAAEAARAALRDAYRARDLPLRALLGVGISVSGPVRPDGRIQRSSMVPTWAGVDIREAFEPALERPIFADNESNCAAIAEMTWGVAVGREDFVLFKVDVGVGGAIVAGGRILRGAAGGAGEFGHMTIDPDGELCRCGNRGCLELSGSFIRALELASKLHRRPIDLVELVALAREGDVGAARLIADTATHAGRGLAMIGAALNPPLFVIGGRGALAGDLLLGPLIAAYERHTLIRREDVPEAMRPKFLVGRFTENDSLMGAVGLVLRHHGRLR